MQPQELVDSIVKLVSLPQVYLRVKSLLDDPDASLADVGEVITQDPGLTSRLLKITNSAFFGFPGRIETVSRAVTILGTQQLHDLLLATSVATAFSGLSPKVMDMDTFWRNSVYCGVAARLLATRCNVLDSERLFVEGLLCDIGHLIMYQRIAELAEQALVQARKDKTPLYRAERDLIGFDYAQVGGILMRDWNLPPSLQESVLLHPEPAKATDYPLETAIVHIARIMVSSVDAGDPPVEWADAVAPVAWQTTGLSEDAFEPIHEEALQRVTETVELILPREQRIAS
jgi:HD-like signal output (HDOD) protein